MSQPWTVKYRPKSLSEVVGNSEAKKALLSWLRDFQAGRAVKKAALLYGPSGTGKTVTVEAAARDLNLDLVEVNASDKRTGELLERIAGRAAVQGDLYGRGRIILLDEIDGINLQEDKGAVPVLLKILAEAENPIVFTANDPWNPMIRPLREASLLIEFKRLGLRDSIPFLRRICSLEGVEADDKLLKTLVEKNNGDMRGIINDLETLSSVKRILTHEDLEWLAPRDRKEEIFNVIRRIFYARDYDAARRTADLADMDYETLFEWIYENAPHQLKDIRDLAGALSALAKADLYIALVKRLQIWSLIPYALDLMTAGVASSKKYTKPAFTPVRFPERLRYMSRTMKHRETLKSLCGKIGAACHISARRCPTLMIPYLKFIFRGDGRAAEELRRELNLTDEEAELLGMDRH
ncbi:MAG: replication factor C large subunit [Candidatus Bathyarchaeia archaeon]|nr:replication factor C large subunit [Candidatus Bathyarchaeota archaeon]